MIEHELDRVWPWLEAALAHAGDTHRKEHILARILDGRAQLWTEPGAACVTSIERSDTGLREVNGWLAGGDLDGVRRIVARAEQWGREIGCQRALITGRRGWLRALPGYREAATVLIKDF